MLLMRKGSGEADNNNMVSVWRQHGAAACLPLATLRAKQVHVVTRKVVVGESASTHPSHPGRNVSGVRIDEAVELNRLQNNVIWAGER